MASKKFHFNESELLSAFNIDRKLWVEFYQHIEPNYFESDDSKNVFKATRAFFNKYKEMPDKNQVLSILKKRHLEDSVKFAEEVYSKDYLNPTQMDFIKDEVRTFIKNEKIKNQIFESANIIEEIETLEENFNYETAEKKYKEIENLVKTAVLWGNEIDLGREMSDVDQRFEDAEKLHSEFIETPWPKLNRVLGGGLFKKELTYLIANSSVGKSVALDQISAFAWMQNKNVLSLTLEMSELRKGQRIDAYLTESEMIKVMKNKNLVKKFYNKNKRENHFRVKEFPTSSISVIDLENYLYELELYEAIHKFDLIVVDYADLLLPKRKTYSDYEAHGAVAEDLRGLAQKLDIPIVSATQFNRSAVSLTVDEINENNIGDSIKKMRTLDTLIALHNTPEERESGIIHMKTIKNRNGQKDWQDEFYVDYSRMTIDE